MKPSVIAAAVAVLGLVLAAWYARDAAPVAAAVRAAHDLTAPASPPTLQSAGVHKCVGSAGTTYLDGPCPKGSRETAANGGTMTVTAFPKPPTAPATQSAGPLIGPIVKPMDPAERDRLRDKQIEDAANRP